VCDRIELIAELFGVVGDPLKTAAPIAVLA
jgi:hypothetical protein